MLGHQRTSKYPSIIYSIVYQIFLFAFFCTLVSCQSRETRMEQLKSEYAENRVEAIHWLYEERFDEQLVQKTLENALEKDESPLVKSLAIRLMVLEQKDHYLPLIVAKTQHPHHLVRIEAVQAIGSYLAYDQLEKLFEVMVKEKNAEVRLKILKSIEYMNAKESLPSLIAQLDDPDPTIQFQTLMLVERFTGEKVGLDKETWEEWWQQNKESYLQSLQNTENSNG